MGLFAEFMGQAFNKIQCLCLNVTSGTLATLWLLATHADLWALWARESLTLSVLLTERWTPCTMWWIHINPIHQFPNALEAQKLIAENPESGKNQDCLVPKTRFSVPENWPKHYTYLPKIISLTPRPTLGEARGFDTLVGQTSGRSDYLTGQQWSHVVTCLAFSSGIESQPKTGGLKTKTLIKTLPSFARGKFALLLSSKYCRLRKMLF